MFLGTKITCSCAIFFTVLAPTTAYALTTNYQANDIYTSNDPIVQATAFQSGTGSGGNNPFEYNKITIGQDYTGSFYLWQSLDGRTDGGTDFWNNTGNNPVMWVRIYTDPSDPSSYYDTLMLVSRQEKDQGNVLLGLQLTEIDRDAYLADQTITNIDDPTTYFMWFNDAPPTAIGGVISSSSDPVCANSLGGTCDTINSELAIQEASGENAQPGENIPAPALSLAFPIVISQIKKLKRLSSLAKP